MRAGNLRERVTFQTKTEVSDGISAGGTETWTDTLTGVPAAIWPLKGRPGNRGHEVRAYRDSQGACAIPERYHG
jgi:head-tail adaptor